MRLQTLLLHPYLVPAATHSSQRPCFAITLFSQVLPLLPFCRPPQVRLETLQWHMKDKGCERFELLERAYDTKASLHTTTYML